MIELANYWFLFKNDDRLEGLGILGHFFGFLLIFNFFFFIVVLWAVIRETLCIYFDFSFSECDYDLSTNLYFLLFTISLPLPFHIFSIKRNRKLKVWRYKNYGNTDSSVPDESIYDNHFYWSFYELSNGKIISLQYVENLTNNKASSYDYEFSYANNYQFGQDFLKWFNGLKPVKDLKELKFPSKKEKECVKDFFDKNILKTKEIPSKIMDLH